MNGNDGVVGAGVEYKDAWELSDIGSRAREKVEFEALGVCKECREGGGEDSC
jgi:hypothetical protein